MNRVIIVIEQSNVDGLRIVTRTEWEPTKHVVISHGLEDVVKAYETAKVFARGIVCGSDTEAKIVMCEDIPINLPRLPVYHQEDRSRSFDSAWDKL